MPRPRKQIGATLIAPAFDAQAFLNSAGITKEIVTYRPLAVVFSQGDPSDSVMYIQKGAVRLSVVSHSGKEAIGVGRSCLPPSKQGVKSGEIALGGPDLIFDAEETMRGEGPKPDSVRRPGPPVARDRFCKSRRYLPDWCGELRVAGRRVPATILLRPE